MNYKSLMKKIQKMRKPLAILKSIADDMKLMMETIEEMQLTIGQDGRYQELKKALKRSAENYDKVYDMMLKQVRKGDR